MTWWGCPECGAEREGYWREHVNAFAPAHPTCPNCHTAAAPVERRSDLTREAVYALARSEARGPGAGSCPICGGAGCRPCRYTGEAL